MKNLLPVFMCALVFCSCSKSSDSPPKQPSDVTVYVSGFTVDSVTQVTAAKYWKDDEEITLSNGGKEFRANAICTVDSDVYVAGDLVWALQTATWKNNFITVYDGSGLHRVKSMIVSDSKIYMAGTWGNGQENAQYWIDGVRYPLGYQTFPSEATGISVVNGDVYVSFSELTEANNFARYAKNGVITTLSDTLIDAEANAIYVSGNDVYVAGGIANRLTGQLYAVYWKNGTMITLGNISQPSDALGITVTGNDVYVCGDFNEKSGDIQKAVYWKNGQLNKLTDGSKVATATAIASSGNNIYIAGTDGHRPVTWKNGVGHTLSNNPVPYWVTGISLVKK